MVTRSTRDALLEEGALLFARSGPDAVSAKELHAAIGARNESALHYHFGGKQGLVEAILRAHVDAVEARRAPFVATIRSGRRQRDLRALVEALVMPMANDLETALGRAHLRLVAHLSHPALAYREPFQLTEAPAGRAVAQWTWQSLDHLPDAIRGERVAALRTQLITLMGQHAQLIDDGAARSRRRTELFLANLVDMLVAGLAAPPSPATTAALDAGRPRVTSS